MTQIARGLGVSLVLVFVLGVVVLVTLGLYARSLRRRGSRPDVVVRRTSGLALVLVILTIAAVTLVPTASAGQEQALNLVPGQRLLWPWQSSVATGNILGNITLFVPLGFLLPLLLPRLKRLGPLLLVASAASAVIEALQYMLNVGRSADINDMLFNILGAACGWTALLLVRSHEGRSRGQNEDRSRHASQPSD